MPSDFKGVRKEDDDDDDDDDDDEEEEEERTRAPEEAMEEERHRHHHPRGAIFRVAHFSSAARSVSFASARKNGGLENHHHFLGRRHKRYKKNPTKVA